ncbi:hypothetical protein F1188_16970 [Roseospira marina]|uniref:DUF1468 domain-containing protein n=1 Tax=Roseospira marina TaxID=140057 RepID=A0A5M6I7Q7_9PROT|nr:tripartite tricarboxylate transporter TctB family protein [Roseospira marina]KAA5604260.1 hypothetical protein F1188_16970 [Roseospira marina]MBB4315590.1 hypothetical protein [Roseospira marina]MBB5088586.1 hypothetical protein [Roseospira marina]
MSRRAIPILVLLMSVFWFYKGVFDYGVWYNDGPGGGFMPVFASSLAALFAVILLVKPDTTAQAIPPAAFIPLGMVGAAFTLSMLVGLLPALAVMLFLWLWLLERYRPLTSLFITFWPMLVVYGIFRLWLNVPFPTGLFGV